MVYQGKLFLQMAGANLLQGTINIQDNICHHVAVVRSGTTTYFFIDGNADGSVANSGQIINTTHALWIGRDEPASATTRVD